jgi:hypothetical protein
VDQLSAALPLRGSLVVRKQGLALINKGRADGVQAGMIFDIVKKGRLQIANEGIALFYTADDLVGTIGIDRADEEVAAGTLTRNGFFDRIEPGDEFIRQQEKENKPSSEIPANPELRTMLRTLR